MTGPSCTDGAISRVHEVAPDDPWGGRDDRWPFFERASGSFDFVRPGQRARAIDPAAVDAPASARALADGRVRAFEATSDEPPSITPLRARWLVEEGARFPLHDERDEGDGTRWWRRSSSTARWATCSRRRCRPPSMRRWRRSGPGRTGSTNADGRSQGSGHRRGAACSPEGI
jgi:hypothetical protein